MRIESFWAKGFRSLRNVRLDGLGPFNVLYGENGSGKSNILEAIRVLFEISRVEPHLHGPSEPPCVELTKAVLDGGILRRRDLYARDDARTIILGARCSNGETGFVSGPLRLAELTVEFTLDWVVDGAPEMRRSRLESNGQDIRASLKPEQGSHLRALLTETLPMRAYTLVDANRTLVDATQAQGSSPLAAGWRDPIISLVRQGQISRALLAAQIGPSSSTSRRVETLRKFLEGPPLERPPFRPVQHPDTGFVELHERLRDPNPDGREIPIDLAGLGIKQIYAILAQAMLSGARAVGLEEPEAHLHAPTTGLHLRALLKRLVDEQHIDQLFIATHSNVFDLDETGYWDVRLEDGETKVEKKLLDEIDQHLYEPGPTLHAVEELLKLIKRSDPEQVIFRRVGGEPVTAREMFSLLRKADPIAREYLHDIHRAAVDVVGLRARRKAAP